MGGYIEETGNPFTGKKKEELKEFLEHMGLTYDEQITHSVVLREGKEIIATASCQKNIIKCVAISEKYQGENPLESIREMLPESTWRYLERKKDESCKGSFSGSGIMEQGKKNSNTERTS